MTACEAHGMTGCTMGCFTSIHAEQTRPKEDRGQTEDEAGTPRRQAASNEDGRIECEAAGRWFAGSIALRVTPAVTRLTVYRRPQVRRAPTASLKKLQLVE